MIRISQKGNDREREKSNQTECRITKLMQELFPLRWIQKNFDGQKQRREMEAQKMHVHLSHEAKRAGNIKTTPHLPY